MKTALLSHISVERGEPFNPLRRSKVECLLPHDEQEYQKIQTDHDATSQREPQEWRLQVTIEPDRIGRQRQRLQPQCLRKMDGMSLRRDPKGKSPYYAGHHTTCGTSHNVIAAEKANATPLGP